jgi:hypothetical protein
MLVSVYHFNTVVENVKLKDHMLCKVADCKNNTDRDVNVGNVNPKIEDINECHPGGTVFFD